MDLTCTVGERQLQLRGRVTPYHARGCLNIEPPHLFVYVRQICVRPASGTPIKLVAKTSV